MRAPRVVTIDNDGLATALKKARGKESLREYARNVGVNFATLSRIENGFPPDLLTYVSICDAIGVPLEAFILRWKVSKP